jgi:hypothetical protein
MTLNRINPATGTRPFPQFAAVGEKSYAGNSNFHALQVSLKRSFTHGFLWQTQYQYSKAITDASVGAGETVAIENISCRACDRSVSPYDAPQSITNSAVYQLPFGTRRRFMHGGLAGRLFGGWELSGLFTTRNGLPNLAPGVSIIPAGGQTISQWWNIAAFAVPAAKTWGNSGRYLGRAPGVATLNTALEKRFPIREHLRASFRAEAFNTLNHAILSAPAANISTPATFGKITASSSPRRLQAMFRVEF